ncbi:MAG TPA: aspartate carbamoyltransferase regulatory subunit [Planctomycetes bacterium]|nr:aspartate carbamoyltransferase regulatory subunit [Planctomycetota bacterium]
MSKKEQHTTLQVPAIEHGTVIDHIPSHATLTVVKILSVLEDLVTIGINLSSHVMGRKGVVKIANRKLSPDEVAKIAIIAPRATLSIIESYEVVKKYTVTPPDVVEGIVRCVNPSCITNHETVRTRFSVAKAEDGGLRLRCAYCERAYDQEEIEIV